MVDLMDERLPVNDEYCMHEVVDEWSQEPGVDDIGDERSFAALDLDLPSKLDHNVIRNDADLQSHIMDANYTLLYHRKL